MHLYISKQKIRTPPVESVIKKQKPALVLLDLDDTISKRNTYEIAKTERDTVNLLKKNAKVCLVTNNAQDERCQELAKELGIDYVHITKSLLSRKPFPFKVKQIVASYDVSNKSVLFIGDKLFTDALCALLIGSGACLLVGNVSQSVTLSEVNKDIIRRLPFVSAV